MSKNSLNTDYENDELLCSALMVFPTLPSPKRHQFIESLLQNCDPSDMDYIFSTLPRLHRDFIRLLPPLISHQILCWVHPRDILTVAQISKTWRKVTRSPKLWFKLYKNIGLSSMLDVYYVVTEPMHVNVKKLHLLGNWVKGEFTRRSVQAHSLGILAVSLVGEKYVATASADKSSKVFDIKSGLCLRTYVGHDLPIVCVQMDDFKVVTGSADSTIKIWSLRDEGCHATLKSHIKSVTALKFIGQILISASTDKTIKIWTLNEKTMAGHLSPIVPLKTPIPALTGAQQTYQILSSAQQTRILLHQTLIRNLEKTCSSISQLSPTCVRTLYGHEAGIKCLDFSFLILVSGDTQGFVKVWHIPTGNCLNTVDMNGIKRNPDLQTNPFQKPITDFNNTAPSAFPAAPVNPDQLEVDPISFIFLNESRLALGKFSGSMYLYELKSYDKDLKNAASKILSTASLTGGSQFEILQRWSENFDTFTLLGVYDLGTGNVEKDFNETLKKSINNLETTKDLEILGDVNNKNSRSWALCVEMDEWRLMCGGSEGRCVLWNHREGRKIYTLKGDSIIQAGSKFCESVKNGIEDDKTLLESVLNLKLAPRSSNTKLAKNTKKKLSVSIGGGTGGKRVGTGRHTSISATTEDDNDVKIESKREEREEEVLKVDDFPNKSITGVAFDDRYIVSSSMDGFLRIWDCIRN